MAGGVAAFAVWTLLYEAALGLTWSATAITVVWLVVATPVAFLVGRATYREEVLDDTVGLAPRTGDPTGSGTLGLPCGPGWRGRWRSGPPECLPSEAAGHSGLAGLCDRRTRADRCPPGSAPARRTPIQEPAAVAARSRFSARWVDTLVVLTAAPWGSGHCSSTGGARDDAYYINLSTWVVAHDHFPLRDTMFSDQVLPTSYGGGFPITSIEGLIGSLARLLHLPAPTMAYLVWHRSSGSPRSGCSVNSRGYGHPLGSSQSSWSRCSSSSSEEEALTAPIPSTASGKGKGRPSRSSSR